MVKSVYIHIPFCKSKCHYCSFVSYTELEFKERYLSALGKEINTFYDNEPLNTIYIGGGTPSLLSSFEIRSIIKNLNITNQTEITMELNPDDVDYSYLKSLFNIGINRLSFGSQTFNDNILKQINRRHNSQQIQDAVKCAKLAGFDNISLDFIYGLPNQTADMFYSDLKTAIELGIQHISLYGLSIEKGCYFYDNKPENIADDDLQADMYLNAINILEENGFEHYEVSNFAKEKFYSKHNLNYWNNDEYYGFGVAAHGYKNGIRYENTVSIKEYLSNPTIHKQEKLVSAQEKLEEEIFLGFRKLSGINITKINSKFNIDFEEKYNDIIRKYEGLKLINKTKNGYCLTPNGILVSNIILSEFLA